MSAEVAKNMTPLPEVFKSPLNEYRNPNSEMIEMMYRGELMNKTNHDNRTTQKWRRGKRFSAAATTTG